MSKRCVRLERAEIDYELLKDLPNIFRDANWDVTVTIWNGCKIVAVEAESTLDRLYGLAIDISTSKIVVYPY